MVTQRTQFNRVPSGDFDAEPTKSARNEVDPEEVRAFNAGTRRARAVLIILPLTLLICAVVDELYFQGNDDDDTGLAGNSTTADKLDASSLMLGLSGSTLQLQPGEGLTAHIIKSRKATRTEKKQKKDTEEKEREEAEKKKEEEDKEEEEKKRRLRRRHEDDDRAHSARHPSSHPPSHRSARHEDDKEASQDERRTRRRPRRDEDAGEERESSPHTSSARTSSSRLRRGLVRRTIRGHERDHERHEDHT
mmetsp:Transcript_44700/g.74587  ORF Transcript_44700/g.74587 Transcript_44700/m.74587 type:complete len:249 (-) Transcript_44700:572-1318(-)